MYSALRHRGRRLHELARRRRTVKREPQRVTVHSLLLKNRSADGFCFEVHCSKGTYVRTLAEDMGNALGTVAHLSSLRRTALGEFSVDDAVDAQTLEVCRDDPQRVLQWLLPIDVVLSHLPAVRLDAPQAGRVRCGGEVALRDMPAFAGGVPAGDLLRVYDADGALLAVAGNDGEFLRPKRIFRKQQDFQGPP